MLRPTLRLLAPATCCAALLLAFGAPASADVYTVGSDGACNFSSLTNALLAAAFHAGADEIRLANNSTYTGVRLHLTDWDPSSAGTLTLTGGYTDCTGSTTGPRTVLSGDATHPIVLVDTSSASTSQITLQRLQLDGSGVDGLEVDAGGDVTLVNTYLTGNTNAGAAVDGGTLTLDGADTRVENNASYGITVSNSGHVSIGTMSWVSTNDGPGIYCSTNSTVDVLGVINGNQTPYSGGGVSAASGCTFHLQPGGWVLGNTAGFGGGIYASTGAHIVVDENSVFDPTLVNGNSATDHGGGLFLIGAGTTATIKGRVTDNTSPDMGGGIAVESGATVTMERGTTDCDHGNRCAELSGNQLTAGHIGAAAYVVGGSSLVLHDTYVESNTIAAGSTYGSVLYAEGAGTSLHLEGVGFWDNHGPDTLLEGGSGATITAAFVSASGNGTFPTAVRQAAISTPVPRPGFDLPAAPAGDLAARPVVLDLATANLYSSVYWPNSPVLVSDGSSFDSDCLLVSDATGLTASTDATTSDPGFADLYGGDLHLRVTSPAVDFCDAFVYTPIAPDVDYEARGFDPPENPNGVPGVLGGTYDVGFDEVHPLFADGFETGNTSRWSSAVP